MKYEFLDIGKPHKVRIITQPYQYRIHKDVLLTDGNRGKVRCSMGGVDAKCSFCLEGNRSKVRWILGLISREDGEFYLLDFGYYLFSAIQNLARDVRFGNPMDYDIDIIDKTTIRAHPSLPLSGLDIKIQASVDLKWMDDYCRPQGCKPKCPVS